MKKQLNNDGTTPAFCNGISYWRSLMLKFKFINRKFIDENGKEIKNQNITS